MKLKKWMALALSLILLLGLCACGDDNNSEQASLEKITVLLDWTPNTNHTGLYVALGKGYYKDAGLDVEIQQGPDSGVLPVVASGKAQFCVSFQEEIGPALAAEDSLDVTAVAAIIAHNQSGLISLKEKGIDTPKKMEGKTYATWDTPLEKAIIKDMMEADGGDYSKLNMIPSTVTDVFSALQTNIDLVWVYYNWDGIAAEVQGIDVNYIDVRKTNPIFDQYTPLLAASNTFLEENPAIAKAFVEATAKGYEHAMEYPEESADILLKYAPEIDRKLAVKSQEYLAGEYQSDSPQWGYMDEARWTRFFDWAYQNGIIEKDLQNAGFTNDYLPER